MQYNHLEIIKLDAEIYTVKNTNNKCYVKLGTRETNYLFSCLGLEEEVDESVEELNTQEKVEIYGKFEEWGFLNADADENKRKDITKITICNFNPNESLQKVPMVIRELFSFKGALLLLALTISTFTIMFKNTEMLYQGTLDCMHLSIVNYVVFYVMMIITTMFHEFGHAITCYRHGGKITSMGLMLFFFVPCFFCDVSDIYLFNNRTKSFSVAVAGISVNYAFGTLGFLAYFVLKMLGYDVPLLLFYYYANIGFVAFNLIPFVKLDGYWIATALFGVDNLMDKSILMFLTGLFSHKELKDIDCNPQKKMMLFIYGFIILAFRPFFWVISVHSACAFLASKNMDSACGFVVGFVLIAVIKDIVTLLKRYIDMYINQRNRVLSMI
ncbi:MAG: M50 family metallopeptidase [Pseudobutyrivibrio sp.]|nr:M50 family metallopeptidase [Pseudobutyrivibrio sp.]